MKDWKATVRNWERRDFYGGRDTNGGYQATTKIGDIEF